MNSKFYRDGYYETLKNASDLLAVASEAGVNEKYGIGTSLSILSAEESIKALFILQQSAFPEEKISDFDKIFRNHKVKHEYIREFMRAIMIHFYEVVDMYSLYMTTRKLRRNFEKKNPKIASRVNWIKNNQKFTDEMLPFLDWLEKANSQKNKGLYVDIKDGKWESPNQTSQSLFEESIYNAKEIYRYVEFTESALIKTEFGKNKGNE